MSSRRWFTGPLSAVAVSVALAVTGCGGGHEKEEVASAHHGGASAHASRDASGELATYVEGQRKWVACLRHEGLDVPDPDAKGLVDLGHDPKWKSDPTAVKAQQKCAHLSLPVPEDLEKEQRPKLSKKEAAKNRRYSECMQEHGAPDFPDIDANGYFQQITWDSASAGGKRATRVCAPILGIPADAGTPKG
jgi:hypothetical protein